MIGADKPYTNPAQAYQNGGFQPNAAWNKNTADGYTGSDVQPSIRGRQLYIPLEAWFTYGGAKTALPLVSLQYQEIFIKVRFRPIREIFTIRDVQNPNPSTGKGSRKAPNAASALDQLYWFLQHPQDTSGIVLNPSSGLQQQRLNRYIKKNNWKADIHLMGCYVLLSEPERR